jgi:hypothetical protein
MASVQMNRFAAESGRMPPVCICCGTAAAQHVRHTFYYQPTWLVLIYILLPRPLKWYLSSNPATVTVPVCSAHRRRLKFPTYISYALAGGLLLMVPLLLFFSISGWLNALSALLVVALLWSLALWAAYVVVTLLTPRADNYTPSHIMLTAVSPAFAQGLQVGGAGVQQKVRPLPGLGGPKTVGGMSQGMLALLIMGGGFAAFLVLCFAIGFASYYVRKSRFRDLQAMSQPPSGPPPWAQPNFQSGPPIMPGSPPPWMPSNGMPSSGTGNTSTNSSFTTITSSRPGDPDTPWNEQGNPVFSHPRAQVPTVFPTGSTPLAASSPLKVGDKVWVLRGGMWSCGIVLELLGPEAVKVHMPPTPANFADLKQRSELRLAASTSPTSTASSAASPPANTATTNPTATGAAIVDDPSFGENTPVIQGPFPPPGTSEVTTQTPLRPGNKLWHLWAAQWYPCEVVSIAGSDLVRVHYYNYTSSFDADVPRGELRLPQAKQGGPMSEALAANGPTDPSPTNLFPPSGPPMEIASAPTQPEVRTWTDASGKFKIEAKLLEVADGKVKLEKADGKIVTLPLAKLSVADRAFVKAMPR